MNRERSLSTVQLVALLAAAAVAGALGVMVLADAPTAQRDQPDSPTDPRIDTFESAEEFRSYLREGDQRRRGAGLAMGPPATDGDVARGGVEEAAGGDATGGPGGDAAEAPARTPGSVPTAGADASGSSGEAGGGDRRASDTNVRVRGIDEPDVLKTTADTLYYSVRRGDRRGGDDVFRDDAGVRLIDADDPAAPEVASRLNVSGRLLLSGDTLVVFDGNRLVGYDVSNRSAPERTWSRQLGGRVVAARLHAGTIYLVTADDVDRENPCPVEPMEGVSVPCTEVHHPVEPTPVDATYTVSLLDPADGSVADSTSFVASAAGHHRGPGGGTVVYVSADRVYLAYPQPVDEADLMARFLLETQTDRLDDATVERIREIRSYDLGPRAERIELQRAIETWLAGLDPAERRAARRGLEDDRRQWAEENKRAFARTGVVTFEVSGVDDGASGDDGAAVLPDDVGDGSPGAGSTPRVEVGATGSVPGYALNQFSLDEHEGQFRIATTVPGAMGADSENDLYVLDADTLETVGSVQGMGVTERIYSVRYVGDEAYVVTFRRIDPFHVVDLSDPADPTVEGELKLPGFSSYLHPLSDDRVLGIGEESGNVKLVVFDVSDPSDPTIESERILDARWSGVAESHHAFLLDRRHEVFFLPTGGGVVEPLPGPDETPGAPDEEPRTTPDDDAARSEPPDRTAPGGVGYVFSYDDGLAVETTVETAGRTRRAAYVGDHLYVFGEASLTVVDETTWERTATVEFTAD